MFGLLPLAATKQARLLPVAQGAMLITLRSIIGALDTIALGYLTKTSLTSFLSASITIGFAIALSSDCDCSVNVSLSELS